MSNKIVKFTDLLDCPKTLVPNDLIVVNNDGSGLTEVNAGAILPPFIGLGTKGDIPVFNDPLSAPPIFVDSGVGAGPIPPSFLPITGQFVDMDTSNPLGNLIAYDNFNKALVMISTGTGQDSDVIIGNNSTTTKGVQIFNQSTNGDISLFSDSGNISMQGDEIYMSNTTNNNSIYIDNNQLNLNNSTGGNALTLNNTGINLYSNGLGQNISTYSYVDTTIQAQTGNIYVQSYAGNVTMQELANNNTVQCSSSGSSMQTGGGNNIVEVSSLNDNVVIKNNTNNNYILVNSGGVLMQADGTNGILVQTGGNTIINSSYFLPVSGNNLPDQICVIDASNQMSFADKSVLDKSIYMASIDAVPAGALWTRTIGTIPYNSLSYPGFETSQGTDISYNNVTGVFSLKAGKYKCLVVQSVNVASSVVIPELSNFRIQLLDSSLNQIAQDSGRYETLAGMVGVMLAYDVSLNIVFDTLIDDTFTINVTDETGGGLGGALLGKASVIFERVG